MKYTRISTKTGVKKYLAKRLRLNDDILEKMAEDIMYKSPIGIVYNKRYDRLYFYLERQGNRGWVKIWHWLVNNAKQCACCGEWFKQDSLCVSFNYKVSLSFNCEQIAERLCCQTCSITPMLTMDILLLMQQVVECHLLTYDRVFRPVTHIAGRYIHHEYGNPIIF